MKKGAVKKAHKSGKWLWAPALLLTLAVYSGSTGNGFTNLDDDLYILQNKGIEQLDAAHIQAAFSSFYLSNYHPLTTLSYMLEYHYSGRDAGVYHRVNLLLHLLNVLLVYLLTLQLAGRPAAAMLAALLFGIHPMHVESVAWISERKDVLCALFYFSALLVYLRYIGRGCPPRMLLGCGLLFACSLLSKSMAVTLPLIMLLADLYVGRPMKGKALLEKLPFFLLSLIIGLTAIRAQQSGQSLGGLSARYGLVEHALIVCRALAYYLLHLIAPLKLSVMHPFPSGALPWYDYATPLLLAGALIWLLRSQAAYKKQLLFASLFLLFTLLPVLQIIPVGNAFAAERYTYLPYTGFFMLAGHWMIRPSEGGKLRPLYGLLFGIWMLVLALSAYNRTRVWKDSISLSSDLIAKEPELFYGYLLRGNALNDAGKYAAALRDLNKAVGLRPALARNYISRGIAHRNLGRYDKAIADYGKALELQPGNSEAWNNRGNAYALRKRYREAVSDFTRAIELDKSRAVTWNNRGNALLMMKDYARALEDYNRCLALQPENHRAYYNRALAAYRLGRKKQACKDWQTAMRLGNKAAISALEQNCK